MEPLNVIIRTADQTKKAEVSLEPTNTGADVIQAAIDNWSLPSDTDYTLVNASGGESIVPASTLKENNIQNGAILEIQPVLVAG